MAEGALDAAQSYFDKAFALPKAHQSAIYPILLNEQATLHVYNGNYQEGMSLKKQVIPYLKKVDNLETHISVYSDIGLLYRRENQTDSAVYYYDKALDIASQYPDKSWMALLNMNLAVLYYNLNRFDKAEAFIEQAALYIQEAYEEELYINIHQIQANVKTALDKPDEAKSSLQAAWTLATQSQLPNWQMRCLPALLSLYQKEEKTDSVNYFLNIGERLCTQLPEQSINVLGFLHAQINVYFQRGDYQRGIERMLELKDKKRIENNTTFYHRIATGYHQLGKLEPAYQYMDSARIYTDSMARADLNQRMAELNVKYDTQNKEYQISLLKQEKMEKESIGMKIGMGVILLITLLVVGLLMLYHKRKMALALLVQIQKKSELAEARKYIEGLENERKRLAKELHDGVANHLLGLQLQAESMADNEPMLSVCQQIKQVRENIREISHELMPPEFSQLPLNEILLHYVKNLQRQNGKSLIFQPDNTTDWKCLSNDIAYEVYRILQESLSNILKHSHAKSICIYLEKTDAHTAQLRLVYAGPKTPITKSPKGIGLFTMNDRAKSIQGEINHLYKEGKNEFILTFSYLSTSGLSPK